MCWRDSDIRPSGLRVDDRWCAGGVVVVRWEDLDDRLRVGGRTSTPYVGRTMWRRSGRMCMNRHLGSCDVYFYLRRIRHGRRHLSWCCYGLWRGWRRCLRRLRLRDLRHDGGSRRSRLNGDRDSRMEAPPTQYQPTKGIQSVYAIHNKGTLPPSGAMKLPPETAETKESENVPMFAMSMRRRWP
jgi:hypothetical protein